MNIFYAVLITCGLIIIIFCVKNLSPKQIIISIISALVSLIACDIIVSCYSNGIPINYYTLTISAIGGIPAVILLLLIKSILI